MRLSRRCTGNECCEDRCDASGTSEAIAAATVNRFCASGLQATVMAAHSIVHDGVDIAIGGGVESITSLANMKVDVNPWVWEHQPGIYMVMGDTAEVVAKRYGISRQVQDEYALLSQQRTANAQRQGYLDDELAPIEVKRGTFNKETRKIEGEEQVLFATDECNRPDTTIEGLAQLPPVFDRESGAGTVTAGNASQMSDGASVSVVMSRARAESLGIQPKVAFRGYAVAGCKPDEMGIGACPRRAQVARSARSASE